MPSSIATVNPTSTYAAFAPGFRGFPSEQYVTAGLAPSGAIALPKVDSYPCTFSIVCQGGNNAESRNGTVTIHSATVVSATGALVSLTAAANTIVPSAAGGIITLTAHATFSGGSLPVYVNRIA